MTCPYKCPNVAWFDLASVVFQQPINPFIADRYTVRFAAPVDRAAHRALIVMLSNRAAHSAALLWLVTANPT